MELQHYFDDQREIGERISTLLRNYKKDANIRKTKEYLEARLATLNQYWRDFLDLDRKINEQEGLDLNHPYFKQDFRKQVANAYEELKQLINTKLKEIKEPGTAASELQSGANQGSIDKPLQRVEDTTAQGKNDGINNVQQYGDESSAAQSPNDIVRITQQEEQQRRFKRQQVKFDAFIRSMNRALAEDGRSKGFYKQKIKLLTESWASIAELHEQIMSYATEEDYQKQYLNERKYEELEAAYEEAVSQLQEQYDQLDRQDQDRRGIKEEVAPAVTGKDLKLPRLQIPSFSGSYLAWKSFHDLFVESIHRNGTLSKVQKMQYLKMHLTGEAARIIHHLTLSNENYETAWELLVNRYNNIRLLVNSQLQVLLSQETLHTESGEGIKRIHDTTRECLQALSNLDIDTSKWGPIVVYILTQKLDKETHRLYENSLANPRELQTLSSLLKFLESRFQALEAINENKMRGVGQSDTKVQSKPRCVHNMSRNPSYRSNHISIRSRCFCCKATHSIYACNRMREMNAKQRLEIAQREGVCLNCLQREHMTRNCPSQRSCQICEQRHHTMLHYMEKPRANIQHTIRNREEMQGTGKQNQLENQNKGEKVNVKTHVARKEEDIHQVLLATALVKLTSKTGENEIIRALIDQGSEASFICEDIVQRLQLRKTKVHATIQGVGESQAAVAHSIAHVTISSTNDSSFSSTIKAFVLKTLTKLIPSEDIQEEDWEHTRHLVLADPKYNKPGRIHMILGSDVYARIILNDVIKGEPGMPVAQRTTLGWILSGPVSTCSRPENKVMCLVTQAELNQQLEHFWKLDEISESRALTKEEKECEEFYKSTYARSLEGRYTVRIPFKNGSISLGESKPKAIARLLQMEKKFAANKELKAEYIKFMEEYEALGHMKEVKSLPLDDQHSYYLPHQAVMKEDSTTTKLRVVFDASAKTSTGCSLNDIMHKGLVLQDDLTAMLIRWRKHKIVYKADIEKMYRQINIAEEDQDYQRILWRKSTNERIKEYRLTTLTYGMTASPFLAKRTLRQLAIDEKASFPKASEIANRDFYMDDLLSGDDTVEGALQQQRALIEMLKKGGFNLRKWTSNHPRLLSEIPESLCDQGSPEISMGDNNKALGVYWSPRHDVFTFKITLPKIKGSLTKRTFLSDAAKIFDPLGWLAPSVIKIKLMFQDMWLEKLEWDDALPNRMAAEWIQYVTQLKKIEDVSIPRWIEYEHGISKIELHGFCDASERAYAAVVYSRIITREGSIHVNIVAAKTKVAPINKKISIPRLELCAAVLLADLLNQVKVAMDIDNVFIYGWTDSEIVLAWLEGQPNKWKTFVANRTSEIHNTMTPEQWHHVRSEYNPADCASRGILPAELVDSNLWWKGPDWLHQKDINYVKPRKLTTNTEAKRVVAVLATSKTTNLFQELLAKFSSLTKVVRVTSYITRFCNNVRQPKARRLQGPLASKEIENATKILIKAAQQQEFSHDIERLHRQKELDRKSKLLSLNPFVDASGILRVGGRLEFSSLAFEKKHPAILPQKSPLTTLIIDSAHKSTLHGSCTLVLSYVQRSYWIIRGKREISEFIRRCIRCTRFKAKTAEQLMGSLPSPRLAVTRPFTHTGVDYAGPIELRMSKGRGAKSYKGYIAVFICLSTKALHIEAVSDLTAHAFIAALSRFIGRRGSVAHIYSDNATNFVGANKILQINCKEYAKEYHESICNALTSNQVQWHFIPPSTPHFGGLWEAGVKSIKYHLRRTVGNAKLTFEELSTVLIQIEACLNSRPLCPMSGEPDDLEILTPGHFLIGDALKAPPQKNLLETNPNHLNRWQLLQRMHQEFWRKWKREYLTRLQRRPIWATKHENIIEGELVLIKDDDRPPSRWLLARVLESRKGKDGLTRRLVLKTATGKLERGITEVCRLPVGCAETSTTRPEEMQPKVSSKHHQVGHTKVYTSTGDKVTKKVRVRPTTIPGKPSMEALNNGKSAKRKTIEGKEPSPKKSKPKSTMSMTTLAILCTLFFLPLVLATDIIEVTPFRDEPGIFFEEAGRIKMRSSDWNIIVYYDLAGYWLELKGLRKVAYQIKQRCNEQTTRMQTYCQPFVTQLEHQIEMIEHNHDILYTRTITRNREKRGLLNIIGTIENKLFGVLDEEFANRYEKDIAISRKNENHLQELLKNQTSITESTINILRKSTDSIYHQFDLIDQHVANLSGIVASEFSDQEVVQRFQSLALYVTLTINEFQRAQRDLIDVVTGVHLGKISLQLMTPLQFEEQLMTIKNSLPTTLVLPTSDLLTLYHLITVRTRVSQDNVICTIKVPLVDSREYQLLKLFPVPAKHDGKYVVITPSTELLVISLDREYYTPMTDSTLSKCIKIGDEYLCQQNHPIYNIHSNVSQCEMHLLNHDEALSPTCSLYQVQAADSWTKLQHSNRWIFIVRHETTFNIICGSLIYTRKLRGSGLLKLQPGCTLKQPSMSITSHHAYSSRFNASFVPSVNISDQVAKNPEYIKNLAAYSLHDVMKVDGWTNLQTAVQQLRIKEKQLAEPTSHDLHQYTISYLTVAVLLVLIAVYIWQRYHHKTLSLKPPKPVPRATHVPAADSNIRAKAKASDFMLSFKAVAEDVESTE